MKKDIKEHIKFGTDGWRGVISDNFTFTNVAIVAQAICEWIKKEFKNKEGRKNCVAVGYDARFLSREYAEIVACILAKNDINVFLSDGYIATPALSYGVVNIEGECGIMITASHNPAKFNGIKIKTYQGGGASKNITNVIERYLGETKVQTMDLNLALEKKSVTVFDFNKAYFKFMKSYVDLKDIRKAKFNVIQDAMYGSGTGVLQHVLKGSDINLEMMHDEYNPSFGNVKPEPIEEYVPELISRMKKEDVDLGLILDGDADRIGAVAAGGEFINAQKILGLLILHLVRNRGVEGSVVKTVCGTMMIDKICKKLNLNLYETPVGFKYISDLMVSEKVIVGGEEAGGIGVQNYIPERDGNLAGLLLLEMMVKEKQNIQQILKNMEKEFGRYYYLRLDIDLVSDQKIGLVTFKKVKQLCGREVVQVNAIDGVKLVCDDDSWLMLRPSGTEPLVRVYAEAKSLKRSQQLVAYGKAIFE